MLNNVYALIKYNNFLCSLNSGLEWIFFMERLFIFFSNTFTSEFKSPIVLIWKFLQCLLLKLLLEVTLHCFQYCRVWWYYMVHEQQHIVIWTYILIRQQTYQEPVVNCRSLRMRYSTWCERNTPSWPVAPHCCMRVTKAWQASSWPEVWHHFNRPVNYLTSSIRVEKAPLSLCVLWVWSFGWNI